MTLHHLIELLRQLERDNPDLSGAQVYTEQSDIEAGLWERAVTYGPVRDFDDTVLIK